MKNKNIAIAILLLPLMVSQHASAINSEAFNKVDGVNYPDSLPSSGEEGLCRKLNRSTEGFNTCVQLLSFLRVYKRYANACLKTATSIEHALQCENASDSSCNCNCESLDSNCRDACKKCTNKRHKPITQCLKQCA